MTPKEKAKQLFDEYAMYLRANLMYDEEANKDAKQCALIVVDFAKEFITGDLNEAFDKTIYLFEVKEELEKL
jgi:hypothetical protein